MRIHFFFLIFSLPYIFLFCGEGYLLLLMQMKPFYIIKEAKEEAHGFFSFSFIFFFFLFSFFVSVFLIVELFNPLAVILFMLRQLCISFNYYNLFICIE